MKTYILYQDWRTFQTRNVLPNKEVLSKFAGYKEINSEDIPYKEGYDTQILLDNKLNVIYEFHKRNREDEIESLKEQLENKDKKINDLEIKLSLMSDTLAETLDMMIGGVE